MSKKGYHKSGTLLSQDERLRSPGKIDQGMEEVFVELVKTALRAGASDAGIIYSEDIEIDDDLANLCEKNQRCEQYGLSPGCPPHVAGPLGFRRWRRMSTYSVVVKLDVPSVIMFSEERHEIFRLLHEIVSAVEKKCVESGYRGSKGFAGGSCKRLFCNDRATCPVLSREGECRYPEAAKPSMSGFGVNVVKMLKSAGWEGTTSVHEVASGTDSMTWVAGLVLMLEE